MPIISRWPACNNFHLHHVKTWIIPIDINTYVWYIWYTNIDHFNSITRMPIFYSIYIRVLFVRANCGKQFHILTHCCDECDQCIPSKKCCTLQIRVTNQYNDSSNQRYLILNTFQFTYYYFALDIIRNKIKRVKLFSTYEYDSIQMTVT